MGDINRNALTIGTATITIRVIQVSGHKMTKATWMQIREADWTPEDMQVAPIEVLGWIKYGNEEDTNTWLLWSDNGHLRKGWKQYDASFIGEAVELQRIWRSRYDQLFIAT